MTVGTDSHPDDPHVEALGTVRQVTPPPAARALSTLCHVDYEDAFLVETGPAQDRTGEQWALAILEDAPMSTRNALSRGCVVGCVVHRLPRVIHGCSLPTGSQNRAPGNA